MSNIDAFLDFAESLKLVRKANLEIDGKSMISDIYTDLLPNNGIINKVNLPRTTVITGRKGTGKSTIFLKSQSDLDKNKDNITIYIDAKSLYDNSIPDFSQYFIDQDSLSKELKKYLIYSNLLKDIIIKCKNKIEKKISNNFFKCALGIDRYDYEQICKELDTIESSINEVFKTINTSIITSSKNTIESTCNSSDTQKLTVSIQNAEVGISSNNQESKTLKQEFESKLFTYLDIKSSLIDNLIKIKDISKVKNIYIYLDDFSEIDKDAQILFMDWFIAPINNLSEDFVKFKIAIYPERFYYGKLDNSKLDEISLDFFDAFYYYERSTINSDTTKMEYLALDYTMRLLNNRFHIYFKNKEWLAFFDMSETDIYKYLFKISLNIPRKMGYILSYCYESCLIHQKPITISALENAAIKFYTDITEKYFLVNEYVCKPFDDKISEIHHYELLKKILQREVANTALFKRKKINNFTSHFIINQDYAYLLSNLELNSFISTYNKIEDKNNFFTVYAIDYGLCKKYGLNYGTPLYKNLNKFYANPIFNLNTLIIEYFNSTQVIKCSNGHEFSYSEINSFKRFQMSCPLCLSENKVSKCTVFFKYADIKKQMEEKELNKKLKINIIEFTILDILVGAQKSLPTQTLSELSDYPQTSISLNLSSLFKKGMIDYDPGPTEKLKKPFYSVTSKGKTLAIQIKEMLIEHIQPHTTKSTKPQ